jgi:hypothetical protein
MRTVAILFVLLATGATLAPAAHGQALPFTYQGRLEQNGNPVSGNCDFRFGIYAALTGGASLFTDIENGVPVTDGLFTSRVSAESSHFDGSDRYLEIEVRCPSGPGAYTVLSPRQRLGFTPYAMFAPRAGSAATASNVACDGCIGAPDLGVGAVTSASIANSSITEDRLAFTPGTVREITAGDGLSGGTITFGGTIAVDFGTEPGTVAAGDHVHDERYWRRGGNAGIDPALDYLGTSGNQPFELRANGARALRIEPGSASPNLIGGDGGNGVGPGVQGAAIGGGGQSGESNHAADHFTTIGGGVDNTAGTVIPDDLFDAQYATVCGGRANDAAGLYATIGGGWQNRATAPLATVGGGGRTNPNDPASLGNRALDNYATVAGGAGNTAGTDNANPADAEGATVAGGGANTAGGLGAVVSGGGANLAGGEFATVAGGAFNAATGAGSFAAGRLAFATHDGSFVWGDGSRIAGSQGGNTFNVLATGGIRLFFDTLGSHCDLTSAAGWVCSFVSDRAVKRDVAPVDTGEVLARLAALPVQSWRYTVEQPAVRHVGPMAQDFQAAFGVGRSAEQIDTVDAVGVALAAIQGLDTIVRAQDARIADLEARVQGMARRCGAADAAGAAQP